MVTFITGQISSISLSFKYNPNKATDFSKRIKKRWMKKNDIVKRQCYFSLHLKIKKKWHLHQWIIKHYYLVGFRKIFAESVNNCLILLRNKKSVYWFKQNLGGISNKKNLLKNRNIIIRFLLIMLTSQTIGWRETIIWLSLSFSLSTNNRERTIQWNVAK